MATSRSVSNGQPRDWETAGDTAIVTQELRVTTAADGKRHAQLSCTRFERQTPSAHAMLAQVGQVHLVKGGPTSSPANCEPKGLPGGASPIAISDTGNWQNCGLQTSFPLGSAWKTCRRIFRATRDVGPTSRLQIWFTETGTLYVADVRIVECRDEDAEFTDVVARLRQQEPLCPMASFELGEQRLVFHRERGRLGQPQPPAWPD